ncbi:NAD-dependent epimerase/dehydratase family protein [Listeria grandensis]|uniref:NAD-dependent epimerase/dehydratase family protein n=1 Tax=Listeria grandensis TaxID=1494963 RepID=A0A7X0Y4E3_9LIST|nr:NAD-dependent epimerase/dehydratase family protein [Listeria grandensis]MBC1936394.1 NAD-dependent epimerase/dehydratase family protein [Listeria grandensis]
MEKKRFLITGGCGFIGTQVLRELLETPHEIFVIDDLSSGEWTSTSETRVALKVCDIRSEEATKYILEVSPHYVIHLAAQVDVPTSMARQDIDADTNIMGTINMLLACKKIANFERFIFASSAAVYGNSETSLLTELSDAKPRSPYGMSKLVCEQYLSLNKTMDDFPYCALRFANVYGKKNRLGKDVISCFGNKLKNQEAPILFGSGEQTRDFIFVDDVATALILATEIKKSGIYNIATNEQTSINEVFQHVSNILQISITPKRMAPRLGDVYNSCLSNQKFKDATGWEPKYTLQEGLERMYNLITT